eukprot:SAG11_NODE_35951_length_264_cov_0.630303_1_plen_57_part_10
MNPRCVLLTPSSIALVKVAPEHRKFLRRILQLFAHPIHHTPLLPNLTLRRLSDAVAI